MGRLMPKDINLQDNVKESSDFRCKQPADMNL